VVGKARPLQLLGVAGQGLSSLFGPLVKKHRLAKKLSQETLAEKSNVHPTYIGLLERSQRTPGIDVAERISTALGLRLSQLIAEAEKGISKR
jgi:transcriptional regulator with XRE-family HTH domain